MWHGCGVAPIIRLRGELGMPSHAANARRPARADSSIIWKSGIRSRKARNSGCTLSVIGCRLGNCGRSSSSKDRALNASAENLDPKLFDGRPRHRDPSSRLRIESDQQRSDVYAVFDRKISMGLGVQHLEIVTRATCFEDFVQLSQRGL